MSASMSPSDIEERPGFPGARRAPGDFQVTMFTPVNWAPEGLVLDERVAELLSATRELGKDAAVVPALVVVLAAVDVFGAEPEHAVDEAGELVGGGGDGLGGAEPGLQAAVEGAEGGLAVVEGTGGQTRRRSRRGWPRVWSAVELLAAGDLVPGQRPSQEAKCFSVGQRLMSRPISATIVWTVRASMPSIRVRSTPVMR